MKPSDYRYDTVPVMHLLVLIVNVPPVWHWNSLIHIFSFICLSLSHSHCPSVLSSSLSGDLCLCLPTICFFPLFFLYLPPFSLCPNFFILHTQTHTAIAGFPFCPPGLQSCCCSLSATIFFKHQKLQRKECLSWRLKGDHIVSMYHLLLHSVSARGRWLLIFCGCQPWGWWDI